MRVRWTTCLLAAVLLAVPPGALADHTPERVEVTDREIAEPVEPLGEPARVVLDVSIPCRDNETATAWTRATLERAPEFLVLRSDAVTNDTSEACHDAGDHLVVGLPVEVGFDTSAPAFQPVDAELTVHVQKNHTDGNVTRLDPASATVTATPGYFNLYNVRLERKIGQAGPQESVQYPIEIDNYSNGPTRFEFEVAHPDGVPPGFQPVAPEPVVLESPATGGGTTSASVNFSVFTPFHNGYVNEQGAIQIVVRSYYASDTSIEGEKSHLSTITQARGFYVPGPGALVALVGLAGVALARGRRPA